MGGKGGGGGSTTSYDPVYNAGLLALQQEQQGWAGEFKNMYQYGVDYDPSQEVSGYYDLEGGWVEGAVPMVTAPGKFGQMGAQIADPRYTQTNRTMGDINGYDADAQVSEMEYQQQVIQSNAGLLPLQTELERAGIQDSLTGMRERAPVRQEFFKQALEGVDQNAAMERAGANVAHAHAGVEGQMRRGLLRAGGNVNSGAYASAQRKGLLAKAKETAGARTTAYDNAGRESFSRLAGAMGVQ